MTGSGADAVRADLAEHADPERARNSARFFKTGPGDYGEGDAFIGVKVPDQRAVARRHRDLPDDEVVALLEDPVHEHRLTGALILVEKYEAARSEEGRQAVYDLTMRHRACLDNWDLVDLVAPKVIGAHLLDRGREDIALLSDSGNLWEERMAMVSTSAFIRAGDLDTTWALAEQFLGHDHDLMHKAVGWMLREAGKQDEAALEDFLAAHGSDMPRTMLRYAIERLPEERRDHWLTSTRRAANP